jgi:inner membrane protein
VELLTHALLGAAVGLALRPLAPLPARHGVALTVAGATFPDADFAGFLVSPLRFLADWHQGPTHSLLLLPLWSLLAAALYATAGRAPRRWKPAGLLFAAGLASHAALDVATAYGTMLLYPISRQRFSLDWLYVVDPFFTALVALGLLALRRAPVLPATATALALLGGYLAVAAWAQARALDAARVAGGAPPGRVAAFPQPFSPFNWKLIVTEGHAHRVAHINVLGHAPLMPAFTGPLHELAGAYRPAHAARWETHTLNAPPAGRPVPTAERLWHDERFAPFRRFATHPALHRVDHGNGCLWFTDLRYDLPAGPATFRYGFCPDEQGSWQAYRLRYFSADARQAL